MAVNDNLGLFFNSNNGDRKYNADSMSNWLRKFFTTGVFQDEYQVTAEGGMVVGVGTGYANLDGKVLFNDEKKFFTLEPAHSQYPRIDNVVVERNDNERLIQVKVVKGSYNGQSPVAPALAREDGLYQICLAQIRVNVGATNITQANITDTRPDKALCGWVVGTVTEIDIQQIMTQSQEQFGEWFDHMKDQLDTDAAGHLQNEIDEANTRTASVSTDSDGALHIDEEKNTHAVIGGDDNDTTYDRVMFDVNDSNETLQNGVIFGTAKNRDNKFNDYFTTIARRLFIGAAENEESGESPRDSSLFMRTSSKVQKEVMRGYGGDNGGIGVMIGAGGTVVIGGGESAQNVISNDVRSAKNGTSEQLILAADGNVYIETNANNIKDRYEIAFNNTGNVWFPSDVKFFVDSRNSSRKYADKFLMSEILSNFVIKRNFSADNIVINAKTFNSGTVSITTPSGYKPVGVVGHSIANATNQGMNMSWCHIVQCVVNGTNNGVYWFITNTNDSTNAKVKLQFDVLFVRDI